MLEYPSGVFVAHATNADGLVQGEFEDDGLLFAKSITPVSVVSEYGRSLAVTGVSTNRIVQESTVHLPMGTGALAVLHPTDLDLQITPQHLHEQTSHLKALDMVSYRHPVGDGRNTLWIYAGRLPFILAVTDSRGGGGFARVFDFTGIEAKSLPL